MCSPQTPWNRDCQGRDHTAVIAHTLLDCVMDPCRHNLFCRSWANYANANKEFVKATRKCVVSRKEIAKHCAGTLNLGGVNLCSRDVFAYYEENWQHTCLCQICNLTLFRKTTRKNHPVIGKCPGKVISRRNATKPRCVRVQSKTLKIKFRSGGLKERRVR